MPHVPVLGWLLSRSSAGSISGVEQHAKWPVLAGCRNTSAERERPVPLHNCRPNEEFDFCVASGRFRYLDVRREGPLPIFSRDGFGSGVRIRRNSRLPASLDTWPMAGDESTPATCIDQSERRDWPIRSQSVSARERRLSGVDRALCAATSLTRQRRLAANSQAANGNRFSPMSGFLPL